MCGFLLTNVDTFDINRANVLLQHRGPDLTSVVKMHGFTFVHNLLSINGSFTPQPFLGDGVACVFNGEIYNSSQFGNYDSDGKCLLPAYGELGQLFIRELDGEFAIALLDWRNGCMLLASDVFGSKPIHYSIDGTHIGVASYASALESIGFTDIHRVPANGYMFIDLKSARALTESSVHQFSTDQYRTSFDRWIDAFQKAIRKRTENNREKMFIGLSSGYDSGAISCELNRQAVPHKSYSIMSNEKAGVIEKRLSRRAKEAEFELIYPSAELKEEAHQYLENNVEQVFYNIYSSGTGYAEHTRLHDDHGANGLSIICAKAKQDGRRIYISGQGADEIIADYGFDGKPFYAHSNFGGKFPQDLSTIFPWASFYGSTQESYLMKEEYVAGAYGIEARYPFLDKDLVQEFLNLSHHLKNQHYKSALRYYLDQAGFPAAFDEKFGFVP